MMFRLPVCPHCGTVYRYRDVKAACKQKDNTCYHCKKPFRSKLLPYIAAEILILLPLCVGFNLILLHRMTELNLIALFTVTVGFLLLGYFLFPFFVHFIQTGKRTEKSGKDLQNNRVNNRNKPKQQQSNKKRRS